MAQRKSTLSNREWLKQQKYWRVEQKVGAVHLAIEDSAIDGYQTFCGKTIEAAALRLATVVECYSGDECTDCRENVDVWVRVRDPEASPYSMKTRMVDVLMTRLKPCPSKTT